MQQQQPWTDSEYGFLEDHRTWPAWRIAEALGRTVASVQVKRQQLNRGWEPKIEKAPTWTREEDDFVLKSPHMTAAEVAERLGRTFNAVSHRRQVLVAVKGNKVKFGGNIDPHKVGGRPLIAKTCHTCGNILQADWFRLNTKAGTWTSVCKRCRRDTRSGEQQRGSERVRAQRKASIERFQAITTQGAMNAGQPWSETDHQVLADPDLTVLEKALKLGRTYKATLVACSRGGHRSKVGLGDPERDLWVIYNPNVAA